jgi:hypothetical protein
VAAPGSRLTRHTQQRPFLHTARSSALGHPYALACVLVSVGTSRYEGECGSDGGQANARLRMTQTGVQTRVFAGATRQSRRHAAANTNRPTEVTMSNDGSHTETARSR